MSRNLNNLKNDFMNIVGSISVDELALNQKVVQAISDIYLELTQDHEGDHD